MAPEAQGVAAPAQEAAAAPGPDEAQWKEVMDALSMEELQRMATQLTKGVEQATVHHESLQEEQAQLRQEGEELQATVEHMMDEMRKLNISSGNIVDSKLDEGPLDFIPRYMDMLKRRDAAVRVSEHIGEIKKQPSAVDEDGNPIRVVPDRSPEHLAQLLSQKVAPEELKAQLQAVQASTKAATSSLYESSVEVLNAPAAENLAKVQHRVTEATGYMKEDFEYLKEKAAASQAAKKLEETKAQLLEKGDEFWNRPESKQLREQGAQKLTAVQASLSQATSGWREQGRSLWESPTAERLSRLREHGAGILSRPAAERGDPRQLWREAVDLWSAPLPAKQESDSEVPIWEAGEQPKEVIELTGPATTPDPAAGGASPAAGSASPAAGGASPAASPAPSAPTSPPAGPEDPGEEDDLLMQVNVALDDGSLRVLRVGATQTAKAAAENFVKKHGLDQGNVLPLRKYIKQTEQDADELPVLTDASLSKIREDFGS